MAHFGLSAVDFAGAVGRGWHHLVLSKTVDQNIKNIGLFKSICWYFKEFELSWKISRVIETNTAEIEYSL